MEQLPKIVRDRLQFSTAESHPDPDLLTAFAEHALTQRERNQVVEHLSHCSECREVVALAMPEPEPATHAMPTKSADGSWANWWRWPVLRWGALAACITVVAAAVLLRYPKESQIAFEGKIQQSLPPVPSSAPGSQATPPAAQAPAEISPRRDVGKTTPILSTNALARKSEKPSSVENADLAKDINNAAPVAGAPAAEPRAKQAFAAKAAPAASFVPGKQSSQSADRDKLLPQTMDQTVQVGEAAQANTEIGPAAQDELEKKQKADAGAYAQTPAVSRATGGNMPAPRPRAKALNAAEWSLSDAGVPWRSYDHGKTWQEVEVGGHAMGFRALSAIGSEVWVGGSSGLLYHSSDGGTQWSRVIPTAKNITLGDDINHIEFSDSQHGTITTVNGETWVTNNGGSSWQKK